MILLKVYISFTNTNLNKTIKIYQTSLSDEKKYQPGEVGIDKLALIARHSDNFSQHTLVFIGSELIPHAVSLQVLVSKQYLIVLLTVKAKTLDSQKPEL